MLDINDNLSKALQEILNIEPKTCEHKDHFTSGKNRVYEFIAQQIADVLPELVSIQQGTWDGR